VSGPGRGSISINNPQALQERFDEIFPEYVKTAVLRTVRSDVGCSFAGVIYGNGEIWVDPDVADGVLEYWIDSVNLSPKSLNSTTLVHRLLDFVCDTPKHRILIDSDKQIQYRYRAWNKPKAISEPPDMEIDAGKLEMLGTGPCLHTEWKFTKGKTTFTVSELGCTNGSEPTGTHGFLTVEIDGAMKQELFCK
jgi:hypothetical protein